MVVTPWGASENLRDGMLPPGPGRTRAAVAENQRRRLYGAMVGAVAERGYWNTRVADLVELSGVSLRSFYDLFPDKRACFVATISSFMSSNLEGFLDALGEDPWEEESRRLLGKFAELVALQPAAARLLLIEAYTAGPESVAIADEMRRKVEELVHRRFACPDKSVALPPEFGTVAVTAVLEIARSRLLEGKAQRLPQVSEEIASLLLSYSPPARPLRSAARAPEVRPEERDANDHAERALRAFEALLRSRPYGETTMEQVAKRAKMSIRTLYANFSGRDDLMLAAIDSAGATTIAAVLPAYRRGQSPAEGIRGAFGALFGLLASRPNLAHLLLVGTFEGGARALKRRREALEPLEALFTQISPHRVVAQRVAAEAIMAGTLGLARQRLLGEGVASLPNLSPICTYIALAPFLGAENATAAAEGKSYRRDASSLAEVTRVLTSNAAAGALLTLVGHGARVAELIEALPQSREEIEAQLDELEEIGIIEPIAGDMQGDDRRFTTGWRALVTEEWKNQELDERERVSKEIVSVIDEEIGEAIEAGTFEARPERHLVRMPMWLDEEGWGELTSLLDRTYEGCLEVQQRVQQRAQQGTSEPAVPARVMIVSFESPDPEGDQP